MDAADPAPVVRRATADDLDAVWPLARDFATSFTPRREPFETTFGALLTVPDALLLVVARASDVVGYLLAHRHRTFLADAPVVWVEEVAVDAELRGQGLGRELMTAAAQWAADSGAAYVALASRRSGDFYRALGYEDSATFYKKPVAPR
ncbi:GNAT family N-acetyltransferase [Oerskovia jenensis]|uniref:Ribosomal protein S18 acetylase RimI-like enzyme n=1 Tax=Oerskovia jenensis TaxID=162169 RepID=A0ABS2LF02_9CELL|nr:GNAT family N-acetyltransferase [Oerskovia jenensis]MBM7478981.1 ribosomal protein S18 acetylase RimI-like enzyme [Oerskovia jenensis]